MKRKKPIEILTADEVRAMLRKCGRGKTGKRNRAIVVVLWRAGLRAAEVVALFPRDLDLDTGELHVLRGKGQKQRVLALDVEACAVVQEWKRLRDGLALGSKAPLFCTLAGKPLQTSYLRQLLPRLAKRAAIDKRVHPHALRHTFGVELVNAGIPIHVIQAVMGHASIKTTSDYLAHLSAPEVVAAIRGRPSWQLKPDATAPAPDHPSPTVRAVRATGARTKDKQSRRGARLRTAQPRAGRRARSTRPAKALPRTKRRKGASASRNRRRRAA